MPIGYLPQLMWLPQSLFSIYDPNFTLYTRRAGGDAPMRRPIETLQFAPYRLLFTAAANRNRN